MVFKNSDVASKGSYSDRLQDGDPFDDILTEIAELKEGLEQDIQHIKDLAQKMVANPNQMNVGYLMMLFTNIPDQNDALQTAKTVGVANVIKESWSKLSAEMAKFAHSEKLVLGQTKIFNLDDPNFPYGLLIEGINPDGTLKVQALGSDGKPDPTAPDHAFSPFNNDGTLKSGVPFFDMSGYGTYSGDPRGSGLTFKGNSDMYTPLGQNMINADNIMHEKTLQDMDDLKGELDTHEPQLGGVDTIISVLGDNIAAFATADNPAYTFLASTGALGNLGKTDTSIIDGCSAVLSNINSAKNTVETTMNSTVSQAQVQANQVNGQWQSSMTAVGGCLSTFMDSLKTFISNFPK